MKRIFTSSIFGLILAFAAFAQGSTVQTISFSPIANKYANVGTFSLTATAQSGLTVTFTVVSGGTIASVSGSTVTVAGTALGTVTVRADQAGDANFAAATPVYRSFNVIAIPNTITYPTIPNKTVVGGLASSVNFTQLATVTNGTVTHTSSNTSVATVNASTGAVVITGLGTVTITASATPASAVYATPTSISRTFTVYGTSNTITYAVIANKTIVGGVASSADFTQTGTATDGTVAYASSNTAVATVNSSTGEVTIVAPGVVTLTASATPTNPLYKTPTPISRTFTVIASTNTITYAAISDKTIVGGTASSVNFTQLATATNGTVAHTSSNTSVATVVSATGAVTIVGPGIVTITASATPTSSLYKTPTPVSRTFTVYPTANTISYAAISDINITGGTLSSGDFTQTGTVTNGTLSYASSNTSVATVNSSTGEVTITGLGEVTLTASATPASANYATPSSVSRTFDVIGTANTLTYAAISDITIAAGDPSTSTFTQTATVTNGTASYASNNTSVATVNASTGEVTIVAAGTVTLTASATPTSAGYAVPTPVSRTFTVYKTPNTITYSSIANKTIVGGVASSVNFTQLATATNGTVAHSSSNTAVATVVSATGAVTIVGPGVVTITASATPTDSDYETPVSVSRTFTVIATANTITYPAIPNKTILLGVASSVNFTQLATVTNGTVSHASSNTSVATVDASTGAVTIVGPGIVTLTASATPASANYKTPASVKRTFTVYATANTITYPSISNKTITGGVPSSANFTQLATVTNGTVSHASSNTSVATVDAATGVVTIVGPGTVTLTASATPASTGYKTPTSIARTFTVYASNNTITYAAIPTKYMIDGSYTQTATVTSGTPVYTSNNTSVATVNSSTGEITFVAAGTASITVSATPASVNYKTPVSVTRTFSISKTAQTISWTTVGSKLTTDVPFTVTATASSGLTVTYSVVSGPATVSSNTVTLTGMTGVVKLRATQAGDTEYSSKTADHSFSVAAPRLGQFGAVNTASGMEVVPMITSVSPNPSNGIVTIGTSGTFTPDEIYIIDMVGRRVMSVAPVMLGNHSKLDLSDLNKGVYHLVVEQGGSSSSEKIVIQ